MNRSKEFINKQILKYYSTTDSTALASRLNITVAHLRVKARRLGCRKVFVNDIIDDKKKCPFCSTMKPSGMFNSDKYQKNNIDYLCRVCRAVKRKLELREEARRRGINYNCSLAFNKGKEPNPITVKNGIDGLTCKSCEVWQPLEEYNKDESMSHKKKNYCRTCQGLKRRGII